MTQDQLIAALLALLPPAAMAVLVYFLFRSIVGADAKERKVRAKIEAEERSKVRSPNGEQPE